MLDPNLDFKFLLTPNFFVPNTFLYPKCTWEWSLTLALAQLVNFCFISGSIISIVFILTALLYLVKNCWPRDSIPKDQTSCEPDNRYHQNLIDMDGLILPVGQPPTRTSRHAPPLPAPPSYNDSINLPAENTHQDFIPQFSYSNR